MPPAQTIQALLAGGTQAADDSRHAALRRGARVAWVAQMDAALEAAYKKADEAWDRIFAALPEDLDDEEVDAIPIPPEQAELDSILAELQAVCDHDRWPREPYFKDV
jgi:hypothetical protein